MGLGAIKLVFGGSWQNEFQTSLLSYRGQLENWNFTCSKFTLDTFQTAINRGAEAGLSLCCSHPPKDRFSRIDAHFVIFTFIQAGIQHKVQGDMCVEVKFKRQSQLQQTTNFAAFFLIFEKNMMFHDNRLQADHSHEISCLFCYFWKCSKIWNCCKL